MTFTGSHRVHLEPTHLDPSSVLLEVSQHQSVLPLPGTFGEHKVSEFVIMPGRGGTHERRSGMLKHSTIQGPVFHTKNTLVQMTRGPCWEQLSQDGLLFPKFFENSWQVYVTLNAQTMLLDSYMSHSFHFTFLYNLNHICQRNSSLEPL